MPKNKDAENVVHTVRPPPPAWWIFVPLGHACAKEPSWEHKSLTLRYQVWVAVALGSFWSLLLCHVGRASACMFVPPVWVVLRVHRSIRHQK